ASGQGEVPLPVVQRGYRLAAAVRAQEQVQFAVAVEIDQVESTVPPLGVLGVLVGDKLRDARFLRDVSEGLAETALLLVLLSLALWACGRRTLVRACGLDYLEIGTLHLRQLLKPLDAAIRSDRQSPIAAVVGDKHAVLLQSLQDGLHMW